MDVVLAFTWRDGVDLALSVFLVVVGIGLAYAFLRLAGTFARLTAFIRGAENEVLPLIQRVGGSVERMNEQLDKVDRITESAADAAESADAAVRAVSSAVQRPVKRLSGFAAGVSSGAADLKSRRDWRHAVEAGKEAARRREQELADELGERR